MKTIKGRLMDHSTIELLDNIESLSNRVVSLAPRRPSLPVNTSAKEIIQDLKLRAVLAKAIKALDEVVNVIDPDYS